MLENFGVRLAPGELALLHGRSEGWVAALQMAALTLRASKDPDQIARALDVRSHTIAEYFICEVLEQQPAEVAGFMLETSVLDELTADACAAVTGRQDAAALLRSIEAANLFIVALDDDRTSYRYHHLVREVLRAQLRSLDRSRELTLQLRVAEWLESAGDTRGATRYYLAAGHADRALGLLQERVVADLWRDPAAPAVLDLSRLDPSLLTGVPERLLALAADLLLWGDRVRGGQYLDLLERTQPAVPPDSRLASRLAVLRSLRCALSGEATETVRYGLAARGIAERTLLEDEWGFGVPLLMLRAYTWLEDFEAVDREAAAAQAMPSVAEPARLVDLRGAQALAWFEAGRLARAAEAARPPIPTRGGWDSSSIPSQWTTCAFWPAWRWSSGTSTRPSISPSVRCRYLSASGPSSSSSPCLTGPESGLPAGTSTMRWHRSTQRATSWPGRNPCCWRAPTS
jgi:LuxR family transcriptional regulator, maltose regulon positive regulatory protein